MRCVVVACVVVMVVGVEVTNALPAAPDNLRPLINHEVWEVSGGDSAGVVLGLVRDGVADMMGRTTNTQALRVSPTHAETVKVALRAAGLTHTVTIPNLAAFLQKEEYHVYKRNTGAQVCTPDNCKQPFDDQFMKFSEMESYLKYVGRSPRTEVRSIGKSSEGRDIWLVHIRPIRGRDSKTRVTQQKRKAVWIEAGIHAREWISSATALHLIHNFVKQPLPDYDVYIVPMANPDGYEYSWSNDRMWRKNRGRTTGSCVGVDLNRNWDSHWGVGASEKTCSELYMGPRAFSEPETKALKEEMERLNKDQKFEMVLSLHSFGQIIMYPWGWTKKAAPNQPEMHRIGNVLASAIKDKSGETYRVENSAGGFYVASGATDDWAKEALNVKYVYTIELRDTGHYGFSLPANQIKSTATEIWNAVDTALTII